MVMITDLFLVNFVYYLEVEVQFCPNNHYVVEAEVVPHCEYRKDVNGG